MTLNKGSAKKTLLHALTGSSFLIAALLVTPLQASSNSDKGPRHMAMETLGKNMKAIGRGIKSGNISPDLETRAAEIHEISNRLLTLFPKGPQAADSRAKPEIWSDAAGFEKANDTFVAASTALIKALQSRKVAAAGPALKATGKTCGGCHKPYRLPKK